LGIYSVQGISLHQKKKESPRRTSSRHILISNEHIVDNLPKAEAPTTSKQRKAKTLMIIRN